MIALLQRVSSAQVSVDNVVLGAIDRGLLIFLCAEPDDREPDIDRFLNRLLDYRIFSDEAGKMNRSVRAIAGSVLLIPQFTLAADTRSGLRPGFSNAASPAVGKQLFDYAWQRLQALHPASACGRFGADMQVALVNDGPATFWLRS
ncbi:D-tyrosyl-tRNA(Tyr) deacylase [Permianibacter sp. IMCC34836]|uniref:D-aminoacyl-tRNA deacylase n=1 Tax=Permianibacter fluminis TaxID=2738515 RepID=UPI0015575D4D|nr:D-aminoacyl-tRNA deacylase [Permianibacter fluminis]NQD36159.1 D-tyrosyl-tRNA(Tyr) deacylase [Permianibacter fluminis]